MPAVALTELNNLFSAVKFYRAAEKAGIKPILGSELMICSESNTGFGSRLILLCQNENGYRNLCKLITLGYTRGQSQGIPVVKREWIHEYNQGLLAISGMMSGDIGIAVAGGHSTTALQILETWLSIFSDRYLLGISRCGRKDEHQLSLEVMHLASKLDIPIVAENDVRFMSAEDFEAHEVRACIQQGRTLSDPRRPKEYSSEQYFKSAEEMRELFSDCPQVLENTLLVAQRCNLQLELDIPHMPDYPVPDDHDQNSLLIEESGRGLEERVLVRAQDRHQTIDRETYRNRLRRELDVITSMGFAGYFLIVADFIRWAKNQNIPVGPGRGSGAGSLVAYALGITALDPLDYDLLFERFLNPERVSLPDFDIDFCMERRDEVIEYVAERYGREQVSQIITHGSMAAKAVVRDVGRALGHPYGYVDQIAKLIPFEIGMTLTRALEEEDTLKERYQSDEDIAILIDLSLKLEGLCRNAGRHAGGVVIAPRPLTEYMPLYMEQGSTNPVTQFDMGDVEAIGLVKFDFLGLRTLTIIEWAVRDINEKRRESNKPLLDISTIPLNDTATFELIRKTETLAVFQLESDGMRKLIKRLQPDTFEDLIALVALFRPGPLQSGMVDDFVDRKHGKSRISYPHPALEPVLKSTYGVILYQEQVMQIAQTLAGYTLGSADLLRRAMGKKKHEEMAKQRDIFVNGAVENGVRRDTAVYIFDLMEKFAGYGFNKSHSAAYALIAYQTAWLKAHYPAAFMAAVLSSDMDNTDKVVSLCDELRRMGLGLDPPCINQCHYEFSAADEKTVRYGLGAIKGVGRNAVESIVEAYETGEYTDLFDFCRRCDIRKVNRRVIESLIRSGAMDCFGTTRSSLMATLDSAIQLAEQAITNDRTGQNDLFGLDDIVSSESDAENLVELPEWGDEERLQGEKDTLGLYLKGHPITRYEEELSQFITARLNSLEPSEGMITIAGYIASLRIRTGRRGRMAEVRLDDRTGRVPVTVYSDVYQQYRHLLVKDQLIIVRGRMERDDFYESGYSVTATAILNLDDIRAQRATLLLRISQAGNAGQFVQTLKQVLDHYRADASAVAVDYYNGKAQARLWLGDEWRVRLEDELLDKLRSSLGDDNVKIQYFM